MKYLLTMFLMLLPATLPAAEARSGMPAEGDAKMVSGMSILGNNDAPKSLYIVPWKSSELGKESEFRSSLLDETPGPVDKPVFQRQLDFYQVSHAERQRDSSKGKQ
ncbi:MAG: hypothetical protein ACOY41_10305 [Pseudomonadota bacterium]